MSKISKQYLDFVSKLISKLYPLKFLQLHAKKIAWNFVIDEWNRENVIQDRIDWLIECDGCMQNQKEGDPSHLKQGSDIGNQVS